MPTATRNSRQLIETFAIRMVDGREFTGRMFGTPRPGGRRFTVTDAAGLEVLDTSDCFDFANAANKLDSWIAEQAS